MRQTDLRALARDARLTTDARSVILYYATMHGSGPHPYDADELRELLDEAGPKRIARALKRAERHGYLRQVGAGAVPDSIQVVLPPDPAATVGTFGIYEHRDRRIPGSVRQRVVERDGGRCVLCGATDPLHLDHIRPFSRGGEHDEQNLRVLCGPCNVARGAPEVWQ